jgi:hypothetical protein
MSLPCGRKCVARCMCTLTPCHEEVIEAKPDVTLCTENSLYLESVQEITGVMRCGLSQKMCPINDISWCCMFSGHAWMVEAPRD